MNEQLWFVAFVATPILVVLFAFIAVQLHRHSLNKRYRAHPGE